jgi:hypothetical protein
MKPPPRLPKFRDQPALKRKEFIAVEHDSLAETTGYALA